jgi:hypothetical protein
MIATIGHSRNVLADPDGDDQRPKMRDRVEFARKITAIKRATVADKVLAALGPPDEIVKADEAMRREGKKMVIEPDGFGMWKDGAAELWRYGVEGRYGMATVGEIYLDAHGRVLIVLGAGTPSMDIPFEEETLEILRALDQVRYVGGDVNPRTIIRAVNLIQPHGEKGAWAVIDEYIRVGSTWDKKNRRPDFGMLRGELFGVMRILFDVPVGAPRLPGYPNWWEKEEFLRKLGPRYPYVLVDDVPIRLRPETMPIAGGSLVRPPLDQYVKYFKQNGKLRQSQLRPPDNPASLVQDAAQSNSWPYNKVDDEQGRTLVAVQLVLLLDTVFPIPRDRGHYAVYKLGIASPERAELIQELEALSIRWDESRFAYTFLDGTTLDERALARELAKESK